MKRKTRGRHTIKGSPVDLWKAGRYIEAMAVDPLVEFLFDSPVLTYEQICEAHALRHKLGLADE
jgi:hypothetical protein